MNFYVIFTLVYCLMNLVVYFTAARILGLGGLSRTGSGIFCLAMLVSPFAERQLGDGVGVWPFIAYTWLGVVSLLFLGSLVVLCVDPLLGRGVAKPLYVGLLLAVGLASAYGLAHARSPQVVEVKLAFDDLPPDFPELRVAVISDVHIYSVEAESRLSRVTEQLNKLDYDMLISLGDLIEIGINRGDWRGLAAQLAKLQPKYGKFAIMGNHECYADELSASDISGEFHRAAGFTLLRDSVAKAGGISLAGLDYVGQRSKVTHAPGQEAELLRAAGKPLLLLRHVPDVAPETLGLFDLQLSGHTHGGQIWPFMYLVETRFDYLKGLYVLSLGSRLYVNQGAGTWGPPMRLGSSPEITLLRISGAKG